MLCNTEHEASVRRALSVEYPILEPTTAEHGFQLSLPDRLESDQRFSSGLEGVRLLSEIPIPKQTFVFD